MSDGLICFFDEKTRKKVKFVIEFYFKACYTNHSTQFESLEVKSVDCPMRSRLIVCYRSDERTITCKGLSIRR